VKTPDNLRIYFAFGIAVACGIFLAIAADALNWSNASVATVGFAMAALLGLLGTPLVLLPLDTSTRSRKATQPAVRADPRGPTLSAAELDTFSFPLITSASQTELDTAFSDWTLLTDLPSRPDRLNSPSKLEGLLQIGLGSPEPEPVWANREENQFDYDFECYFANLESPEEGFAETDDLDQEDEFQMVREVS
jgi:hypothetical protein